MECGSRYKRVCDYGSNTEKSNDVLHFHSKRHISETESNHRRSMLLLSIPNTSVRLNCHTRGSVPQWALWWAKAGSSTEKYILLTLTTRMCFLSSVTSAVQTRTDCMICRMFCGFPFLFSLVVSLYVCVNSRQSMTSALPKTHLQNTKYFIPYITPRVVLPYSLDSVQKGALKSEVMIMWCAVRASPLPYNLGNNISRFLSYFFVIYISAHTLAANL